jgi:glycosyltransferase involved in cell wall biosynthesis
MNIHFAEVNSTSRPKLSVCVITYNQSRYIGQCLQSLVEQQTKFPFEILVGDDCSTDGTQRIVREFVDRHPGVVHALFQPRNTGGSRNNLELHNAACGEYVAHVDGDDYALPGKLQAQADALDQDPDCMAVWHRVDYFDDRGGFCSGLTADLSSFKHGRVNFNDALRLGFIGVYSSLMYRRSARSPADPSRQLLDLHLTWDLLSKGHARVLDQVLGRYRIASSGSLTQASHRRIMLLAIQHADELLSCFPQNRQDIMVWALSRALLDLQRRHRTAFDFLSLATRARSLINPVEVARNLHRMRTTQVRWRSRRVSSAVVNALDS